MSTRKCWTCMQEHDLDEACPRSMSARTSVAAGGSASSMLFENPSAPRLGPVFVAGYDSECAACGNEIFEGDEIRADGEGGYIHYGCEEERA